MEALKVIEMIKFDNFKEKIKLTKKYDGLGKVEVIDDKYVYVEREVTK